MAASGVMQEGAQVVPVRCRIEAEASVEKRVSAWAVSQGIREFKFEPRGRRGWPDHMYIFQNRVAFIEFKSENRHPDGLQLHRIEDLNAAGTPAIWTASYAEAVEFLCHNLITPMPINKLPFA